MLSEVINMIEMKVTPEMIRHIIKEKEEVLNDEKKRGSLSRHAYGMNSKHFRHSIHITY